MVHVYIPGTPARLAFTAPKEMCCNCGSTQDIALVETQFKKTRYVLLVGTELTLTMDLPYCSICKKTAGRFRVSVLNKLLVSLGVFFVLLLAVVFLPTDQSSIPSSLLAPWVLAVVALLLTFLFYALRRPSPPQTSYYQPVFMTKLKRKFSGVVLHVAFNCTNSDFATKFATMNQLFINAGALTITNA